MSRSLPSLTAAQALVALAAVLFFVTPALAQEGETTPAAAEPSAAPAADTSSPAPAPEVAVSAEADRESKNSVYLEGLGPAMLWSINYDRLVIDELAVRVGFGYFSFSASAGDVDTSAGFFYFPITASYVGLYSGSHGLEVGGGATVMYATAAASGFGTSAESSGVAAYGTAHVGYRLQPVDYGFQFRAGLMTLFGPGVNFEGNSDWGAIPWGYLSLGGSF